jgi:hypothetical protein
MAWLDRTAPSLIALGTARWTVFSTCPHGPLGYFLTSAERTASARMPTAMTMWSRTVSMGTTSRPPISGLTPHHVQKPPCHSAPAVHEAFHSGGRRLTQRAVMAGRA